MQIDKPSFNCWTLLLIRTVTQELLVRDCSSVHVESEEGLQLSFDTKGEVIIIYLTAKNKNHELIQHYLQNVS